MTTDKPAQVGTRKPLKGTKTSCLYAVLSHYLIATGTDKVSPDPGVDGFWTKDLQRIRDPRLWGKPGKDHIRAKARTGLETSSCIQYEFLQCRALF